jgi:hypothetical protein
MKNWINKNYKTIIITAFLVPIITVAVVSISHVTMWYGLSNPFTWAIYLSIGIEIAALSALAAISADMGSKVYFPFSIVTLIQFIGNIFFAYSFIDISSQMFKDWVDLVSPLVYYLGVDTTDFVGHKRFLAFFAGGMLPVISLSFLHMLVKFTEEDRKNKVENIEKKTEEEPNKVDASDIVSEVSRLRLSEEDLKKLEEVLLNPPSPNDALIKAAEKYKKFTEEEILKQAEEIKEKRQSQESTITENIAETVDKEKQRELLIQIMRDDEEMGLYDSFDDDWGGLTNEELIGDDEIPNLNVEIEDPIMDDVIDDTDVIEDTYSIAQSIPQDVITPALSDEEVREMFMDEWERRFDMVEDEELSTIEPSEEEEQKNFSTIVENSENIFQEELPKFNIDDSYVTGVSDAFDENEQISDSFWRDHLNDESEDDLKKK